MYTLNWRSGTAGFAVEALLAEIRTPFELIDIVERTGSKTPAAFRAVNASAGCQSSCSAMGRR